MEGVKDVQGGTVRSSAPGLHGGRDEHARGCPRVRSAPGHRAQDTGVLGATRVPSTDRSLPKKQRHTAKRIYERLRAEHGFGGKYTIVKDYVRECRCSMKMSVPNCSMKMSVYERTDVDYEGADEDTGVERSDRGQGDGDGGVWADGSERAPCVATTGSIQRGRTCCRGSREQGQEARDHHVPADTREGEGAG